MRVWFDALTAKQARIASLLYIEGASRGVRVTITCRHYDYVESVLRTYGVPYQCVGSHGENPREKLLRGIERQLMLLDVVGDFDVQVSLTSPDAFRIAFGLGKPSIALTDTIHSWYVNKLTLPLADSIVAPSAIPIEEWGRYVPSTDLGKIKRFNGVFELMWILRFNPTGTSMKYLGLSEGDYVVFRLEESRASYYLFNDKMDLALSMMKRILEEGLSLVVFPRYPWQERMIREELRTYLGMERLVIPRNTPLDFLDLAWTSRFVVTGGSTMSHEAALLGVPAINYYPSPYYIDDYLIRAGLPLHRCGGIDCLDTVRRLIREGGRVSVDHVLRSMEDPSGIILDEIERITR